MITMELNLTGTLEKKQAMLYRVVTDAMKKVVRAWHKQQLPRHFKTGAARLYGYKTRSRRYQARKNKKGLPPLVYSGRARRQLTRAIKPTGSRAHVRGKFTTDNTVRYLWQTKPGGPNLGEEIVATTAGEQKKIIKAVGVLTAEGLDKIKDKKRVK